MDIKTFPMQFTSEKLDEIRKNAGLLDMNKKQFINIAIDEKLERMRAEREGK